MLLPTAGLAQTVEGLLASGTLETAYNPVLLDYGATPDRSNSSYLRPVNGFRCNPSRPTVTGTSPTTGAPTVFGLCQPGAPQVTAATPGALAFTNPLTGATVYGAYNRPGLDPVGWPGQPNSFFGSEHYGFCVGEW